ncbi:hypothetical protein B5G22_10660 [Limosilactobacillus reuteri]|jgi:uncharacterized protein (DUF1778 family)|uniref:Uncharacterized protein n=1 Tax=Limosilactobacillus reuteri TaxID=1598 RepID=A0A1Y3U095_LIMRT|nr:MULTISPECIES: hypothetical protein [Limosilactobacillus]MCC4483097.1 hypothetical protein [Limosilactobacillus reuteri]MQB80615.1 hypothetical protein [Limosilactobacillus reuteri]MQB87719.1 hypothetical protein [Limosilactobacillus reuteri]OUN42173.1 hypothetical protein B5G22_10660 [Limosilactobacillus reuteri]OUP84437.1 hypothetical protein B5F04_10435 [Limosilactobacillus reuteri]
MIEKSTKEKYIRARVTKEQKEQLQKIAKDANESESEYILNSIRMRQEMPRTLLNKILKLSLKEKAQGNFEELTLEPVLDSLENTLDLVNGLDNNEESLFYEELLDWLIHYVKISGKKNTNESSYEIPDD